MQRLSAWGSDHPRLVDAVIAIFLVGVALAVGWSLTNTTDEIDEGWQWALITVPSIVVAGSGTTGRLFATRARRFGGTAEAFLRCPGVQTERSWLRRIPR